MTDQISLPPPPPQPMLEHKHKSHLKLIGVVALILFVVIAIFGIVSRMISENHLKKETQTGAIPTVAVISAQGGAKVQEVVLPGTIQAWHYAIIYARVPGYLKSWNVDIGAHVKAGDVLAEIDAPDLDAQFHQAQADLDTAIANNNIAQITAKRYVALRKTDSVSQEQADQAVATAEADQATVESQKANLDHLQQEENFKQVTAPFDGTITQRNTDIGSLINGTNSAATTSANSSTAGQDLFHIAETDKLRVYVEVPENQASAITPDLAAEMYVPQHPQQTFPAKLIQSAEALDPTTRSLLIELEADNTDGTLLSGGYADLHFKLPVTDNAIILPVNALLFRDGMQAGVVVNNHVSLKAVTIGRDYGKSVEIVSGLSRGDQVVVNPPDSLEDGQEVRIMQPSQQKDQGQPKDQSETKADYNSQSQPAAAAQTPTNDQPSSDTQPGPQGQDQSGAQDSGK